MVMQTREVVKGCVTFKKWSNGTFPLPPVPKCLDEAMLNSCCCYECVNQTRPTGLHALNLNMPIEK